MSDHPAVRSPRPTDLIALLSFQRDCRTRLLTAPVWPRVQPETRPLSATGLVSRLARATLEPGHAWLCANGGGVQGLVSVRARAGGLAWDVEHLHVREGADQAVERLLERVVERAAAAGVRRVFLELPVDDPSLDLARRVGFDQYATATLYRLRPPFSANRPDVFEGRPRLRVDEYPLFQLYNAAVPARVRTAEAMTHEEWLALHRGRRPWAPAIFGDRHQYVWELGATIVAWLEVVYGSRSQYLDLLIHPKYEGTTDRILNYALAQTSEKAPVYCAARDYQPALASALEQAGFERAAQFVLCVRHVAVPVREPKLVPAKVVGS